MRSVCPPTNEQKTFRERREDWDGKRKDGIRKSKGREKERGKLEKKERENNEGAERKMEVETRTW